MIRVIGGTHKGRRLATVPGRATRPSSSLVRKALFDIAREHSAGRVLDLFAGTGAIALEALSRGSRDAVAIEQARPALATIRENAARLGLADRLTVVAGDVLPELARAERAWAAAGCFSLIYADPPYGFERWEELVALATPLLCRDGMLALEHEDLSALAGRGPLLCRDGMLALEHEGHPALSGRGREYRYGRSVISVIKPAGAG